ncbi:ArfGap-domain-containing protein [Clavulina sp. PMI_390]|nr:ArfGap-domain-containing protein [Clavulina sp. PMI_390]
MDPSKETTEAVFKALKADKANQFCWDCKTRQPTWCSTTFGVYICLDCSSNHRNMGVHISFVQSSTLDSWQLKHLRTMKVGGNRSATEFYTRHGSAALLGNADTKKKYTAPVADLYRAELVNRVQQDVALFPNGIFVEGAEAPASGPPPASADDDDFFNNWDQPSKASSTKAPPAPSTVANVGLGSRPTPPSNPRTITSASLRSNSSTSSSPSLTSVPSRTPAARAATTAGSSRPAKLGAKKAVSSINFEEAERKAKEEEARSQQLAAAAAAAAAATTQTANVAPSQSSSASTAVSSTSPTNATASKPAALTSESAAQSSDMQRLGIGFNRLGMGATTPSTSAASRSSTAKVDDAPTTARDRFGNQKAISSEMFFERGAYDPAAVSEAKTKLSQFQGATSISSNQYFGREEEEDDGNGASGSFTGNESLSALETATRDALSRVMAKEEVQNAIESVRAGALKVTLLLSAQSGTLLTLLPTLVIGLPCPLTVVQHMQSMP